MNLALNVPKMSLICCMFCLFGLYYETLGSVYSFGFLRGGKQQWRKGTMIIYKAQSPILTAAVLNGSGLEHDTWTVTCTICDHKCSCLGIPTIIAKVQWKQHCYAAKFAPTVAGLGSKEPPLLILLTNDALLK